MVSDDQMTQKYSMVQQEAGAVNRYTYETMTFFVWNDNDNNKMDMACKQKVR